MIYIYTRQMLEAINKNKISTRDRNDIILYINKSQFTEKVHALLRNQKIFRQSEERNVQFDIFGNHMQINH